jgi:ABC-type polysaccharide/polyol phosphate export permease
VLSKKHTFFFACAFMIACFLLLRLAVPIELVEADPRFAPMYYAKIGFVSACAACAAALLVALAARRAYFKSRLMAFGRYRYLLANLVKRDFTRRYRKSVLGVLWSVLNPLLTMLVMTVVFSRLFRFDIPNFPVYLLSGQIIMGFFIESTSIAMSSVIGNSPVIKKVYVPKYIFPLSAVLSSLTNLLFSAIALMCVFAFTHTPLPATAMLFPVPILYTLIFSAGVGLLLASVTVFFRDMVYLYGVFTTLLSYLTPIFYPTAILPDGMLRFESANPLYHYVSYFRDIMLYGTVPNAWANAVCLSFALVSLMGGLCVFASQQNRYILYI